MYMPYTLDDWRLIEDLYEKNHPGCKRKKPNNEGRTFPVREVASWFAVWSPGWVKISKEKILCL